MDIKKELLDEFILNMKERGYDKIVSNKYNDFREVTKKDDCDTSVSLSLDCFASSSEYIKVLKVNSRIVVKLKGSKIEIAEFLFNINFKNKTSKKAIETLHKILDMDAFNKYITYRYPRGVYRIK